jgi:hypothetical protein
MSETFTTAMQGLKATGASLVDRDLVATLSRHGSDEGRILAEYEQYAESSASPAVRYLVDLIMDDERRHHRVLEELANAIAWGWSGNSPDSAVPDLPVGRGGDVELRRRTLALLAEENKDHAELKRLRKQLGAYADSTLWALLVDLMILDTEKHARILDFIAKHSG